MTLFFLYAIWLSNDLSRWLCKSTVWCSSFTQYWLSRFQFHIKGVVLWIKVALWLVAGPRLQLPTQTLVRIVCLFVYTNLVLACNPPPSLPVSFSLYLYKCVCECNSVFFDCVENLSREKEGSQKRDRSGSVRQEGWQLWGVVFWGASSSIDFLLIVLFHNWNSLFSSYLLFTISVFCVRAKEGFCFDRLWSVANWLSIMTYLAVISYGHGQCLFGRSCK